MGTRFLPATKAVPKELLPIGDTPTLQLVIDEALGAGIDHIVVVSSRKASPAIEPYFAPSARADRGARGAGHDDARRARPQHRLGLAGDDRATRTSRVGSATPSGAPREAVGDEPFAVLLPDELMGSSSLLAHMNGVCAQLPAAAWSRSSRCPTSDVGRYGVIDPRSPVDADGVVAVSGMVEKRRSRRGAERPRHHRPLRADPGRVRRDRRRLAPAPRRRDPAHRRVAGPGGALAVPRGRQQRRSLRHRHAARLPRGGDRAGAARRRARQASCATFLAGCRTGPRRRPTASGARKRPGWSTTSPCSSTSNSTRRAVVAAGAVWRHDARPEALVARRDRRRRRASRRRSITTGSSAPSPTSEREPADRQRRRERRARQLDVGAAVELGAVGAVHLAPPCRGRRWRARGRARRGRGTAGTGAPARSAPTPQHVLHVLAADPPLAVQASFSHSQREVLLVVAVPRRPAHVVPVGRERRQR